MRGGCTGSCYSRGCNCYKAEDVHTATLLQWQQQLNAQIVVRMLEEVMVMNGFKRQADGTLISPDGKVIVGP